MADELVLANDRYIRLVIAHWEDFYEPVVLDGITWEIERRGAPSKLEFTIVMDDILQFCEGNSVRLYYKGIGIFYGYIFQKKRDKENHIKIVAYDQLRYFKNKDTYVYSNKTASELVKMLAKDFKLKYNVIEDTKYKISRVEENKTLFDMVLTALDDTLREKKEMFTLYDDFGRITLKNVASMKLDTVMNNDVIEDFDYNSSIDSDTYTKIKLVRDNEETGKRDVYIAQDSTHMRSWGILQMFDTVDKNMSEAEIKQKCDILLKLYNKKTKSLSLKNAIGDIRVRAGCLVPVFLNLGDIELQNYMLVEKVKHTFENNSHFMDLTLVDGDEFASYSSSSYSSGNTNNKDEKKNGPAQSTTKTGKKVPALFTAYYPGNNAMEGGKIDCNGKPLDVKSRTVAGPMNREGVKKTWYTDDFLKKHPVFEYGDKVKIILPGTAYDNKVYTVKDNGGRIYVETNGTYHIDILLPNDSECKKFGRKNGYIIIGGDEEQTYQVEGNNQNSTTNNGSKSNKLINLAKSKLGCKYVYGATGPNKFDCSGFTQWCYKNALGITIPRVSASQGNAGKGVDKSNLQLGDLVFFSSNGPKGKINHVGMYIGNNEFIHSPHTGDVVKISSLNGSYYKKNYVRARRFI
ncbi:C40 family peptidase [Clostridioides sp. ES-S-0145-01]|uniref:XkdQ/YqbQ family protein n=1 Tax=Clostridioides sp. ES-S-0145-01 TaxID=2770784 RepID=UPI001D105B77|nr:C40 family peptidase [Clostridioides sp. ES-S-0145-01]